MPAYSNVQYQHADFAQAAAAAEAPIRRRSRWPCSRGRRRTLGAAAVRRSGDKIGRNDPCPCGSGKKYKQCHGRLG